jgi:hypothetical protein
MYLFSFGFDSFKKSALIFLDPTATLDLKDIFSITLGIVELTIGLFIGGALISIITSSFLEIINFINNGYLKIKSCNHIIILGLSNKLRFILNELNNYYSSINIEKEIVIYLKENEITSFRQSIENYSNLSIIFVTGDLFSWNLYKRININKAESLIYLKDYIDVDYKIIKFIISHSNFNNQKMNFIIETNLKKDLKNIYQEIFKNNKNKYLIVNDDEIITNILSRSIVNYKYFQILSELLSFDGYEIYLIDYKNLFSKEYYFYDLITKFENGVLIGFIRNNKVYLNENLKLKYNDTLILILENEYSYKINITNTNKSEGIEISPPTLKESKKILIVGNYNNINVEELTQFLTKDSVKNIKFIEDSESLFNINFWKQVIKEKYDSIILNIDDNRQYLLTLFLKNKFTSEKNFVEKIINIFSDALSAELITNGTLERIILSEKIIGEYIVQAKFNNYINEIFSEITHINGNEFYILSQKNFYDKTYNEIKNILLNNNMIYIGCFVNNKFIFDYKKPYECDNIVVLTRGV